MLPHPLPRLPMPNLPRRHWLVWASLLAAGPLTAQPANYPSRTLRLLVGDAAGSQADAVARALGAALQAELGQPVLVENRPGSGTGSAVQAVIDAPGDGHTLLLAARDSSGGRTPHSLQDWGAGQDLMPIALVCQPLAAPGAASSPARQRRIRPQPRLAHRG